MLLSLLHTGVTPYGGQDRTAQHALRPPPDCSSYPSYSPHSTREHSHSAELAHAQSPQQLHAYRRRVSPVNPHRWPRSTLRQRRARGKGRMAPAPSARLPSRFSGRCRITAGRATRHRDGLPRTLPAPRGRPAGLLLPPRPGPARRSPRQTKSTDFTSPAAIFARARPRDAGLARSRAARLYGCRRPRVLPVLRKHS